MCQLLGISSNKSIDIDFSLKEFRERGIINYHGFGFAFYTEESGVPKVFKKPSPLSKEDISKKEFRLKSKLIIGHVRLASCGNQSHENTHPFNRGKWSFAHNGTVKEIKGFSLQNFEPEGETDSEHAFCFLLDRIYGRTDVVEICKVLRSEAEKISQLGTFNFLLSDGNYLFAFGHTALFFTKRQFPFREVTLKDSGYSLHLSEIKRLDEKAVIVATEPLMIEETWSKIMGLKVFKDGEEILI